MRSFLASGTAMQMRHYVVKQDKKKSADYEADRRGQKRPFA